MYEKLNMPDMELMSSAHKSIWHSLQMLSSLEFVYTENEQFNEDEFLKGQEEFYLFIKELYLDMLDDPEEYAIPTKQYDEYMKSDKAKKKGERKHETNTKECILRNTFQQAIQFYSNYLYKLGEAAECLNRSDYSLVMSEINIARIQKEMLWTHIKKDNEIRYQKIEELGIEMRKSDGICYITSKKYPKMFLGLWVFCNANASKYKYMNYLRLDYKGTRKATPDIEDIKETLTEGHQQIITELEKLLSNIKTRTKVKPLRNITSGTRWKVEYVHKSKNILGFYAEPDYLMICIYFNKAGNITDMAKQLEQTELELFVWFCSKFTEHLCKCPYNRRVTLGVENRRICGLSNRAEIVNPSKSDVENIMEVLKLFRNL